MLLDLRVWCLLTTIGARPERIRQVLGFLVFRVSCFTTACTPGRSCFAATYISVCVQHPVRHALTKRRFTYFEAALVAFWFGDSAPISPGSTFSLAALGILIIRLRPLFHDTAVWQGFGDCGGFLFAVERLSKICGPAGKPLV